MSPFDSQGMMSQSKTSASQQGKEEAENEEDNHRSAPDGLIFVKTLKVPQMF